MKRITLSALACLALLMSCRDEHTLFIPEEDEWPAGMKFTIGPENSSLAFHVPFAALSNNGHYAATVEQAPPFRVKVFDVRQGQLISDFYLDDTGDSAYFTGYTVMRRIEISDDAKKLLLVSQTKAYVVNPLAKKLLVDPPQVMDAMLALSESRFMFVDATRLVQDRGIADTSFRRTMAYRQANPGVGAAIRLVKSSDNKKYLAFEDGGGPNRLLQSWTYDTDVKSCQLAVPAYRGKYYYNGEKASKDLSTVAIRYSDVMSTSAEMVVRELCGGQTIFEKRISAISGWAYALSPDSKHLLVQEYDTASKQPRQPVVYNIRNGTASTFTFAADTSRHTFMTLDYCNNGKLAYGVYLDEADKMWKLRIWNTSK